MLSRGVPNLRPPLGTTFNPRVRDRQVSDLLTAAAVTTAAQLIVPSATKKREYHTTPPVGRDLVPSNFLGMHKHFLNLMDELERGFTPNVGDWGDIWEGGRGGDMSHRGAMKTFSPKVDVSETEKDYRVHCEVPGIDPKDLKVEFKRGVLSIRGEKKMEKKEEDKEKKYSRVERTSGKFFRSFRFENVEEKDISAKYKAGVLEIVVPKQHQAASGSIEIKTEEGQNQQETEQRDQKDESSSQNKEGNQQQPQQQPQQQRQQQQLRDEQQQHQFQSEHSEGQSGKKSSYA